MSRPVRIAVDQTVNIDPVVREKLGIEVLPIHIIGLPETVEKIVKQGEYEQFYHFLNTVKLRVPPGTQAGSVWEMRTVLERMIKKFNCDIVCFVVSGELSAVYENTIQAARELAEQYPNRVVVFGGKAFLTLSLLAQVTAEYASTGKTLEEVVAFVEDKVDRCFVAGTLIDIRRLRRSGRVAIPALITVLARPMLKIFRVLPVFLLEHSQPRTTALVRKEDFNGFVRKLIRERVGFKEPIIVAVGYAGSEARDTAETLARTINDFNEFFLVQPVKVERASPVIGVHAGSGLVAFGVLGLGYESISTPVFLHFLAEARQQLKIFCRTVNAINIFPVRDGDTGSNLLSPLSDAGGGVAPDLPLPVALSQVAVRIAQKGGGYSGGALAAFFLGFSDCVRKQEKKSVLTLKTLVVALKAGADRCYQYFGTDAKEGTILSVMRAAEQAAAHAYQQRPTFRNVLSAAYLAATDELLNPRIQEVEVLRVHRLMDAGGFGWTLVLWALLRTLGLGGDPRLRERYQLVLKEVKRHAEFGQRLIYRHQPVELRGFCVEGCVQGEVVEELRTAFLALDNRLPNAKMTFNVVNGTTHFHIHVSAGLENEVQRIAARFGYALPPPPPTRLAKRQREIYRFRFLSIFQWARRSLGYFVSFFLNWVAYAVLFPVMFFRIQHRLKALTKKNQQLQLIQQAFSTVILEEGVIVLLLDQEGKLIFANNFSPAVLEDDSITLERLFGTEVGRNLRQKMAEMMANHEVIGYLLTERWQFEIHALLQRGNSGFLVRCRERF